MHPSAFFSVVKALARGGVEGKRILDIGSADVNSTAQGLSLRAFCASAASYHGIDEQDGDGVDEVVSASDYDGAGAFDIVISTEALEHTPEPRDILACAWRALAPCGVLIVTCAGPERQAHNCDGGPYTGSEHYVNIAPEQLLDWLSAWEGVEVVHAPSVGDVYARATKPSAERAADRSPKQRTPRPSARAPSSTPSR